jgi:hypothetical protein
LAQRTATRGPLSDAAARLRGRPGRPRKAAAAGPQASQTPAALIARVSAATYKPDVPVTCPPRLLDLAAAGAYLGVSPWTVRDLIAAGTLARVRIPLPNRGELRKVLLDREELDRLVTRWKA